MITCFFRFNYILILIKTCPFDSLGDAMIEGIAHKLTTAVEGIDTPEIVPKAQAHPRQQHTRAPAAIILHTVLITALISLIACSHVGFSIALW